MRTTGLLLASAALFVATTAWAQQPKPAPPRHVISDHVNQLIFRGNHDNTRISLDVENMRVTEALKKALEAGSKEYSLDTDLPEEPRVSLKVKNVRLSTALDILTEGVGAGWTVEMRDGKPTYRVGKNVRSGFASLGPVFSDAVKQGLAIAPDITAFVPNANGRLQGYFYGLSEERSTFTCPHCKGTTTLLRQRQQPKCTKCSRTFQSDWQFCPADGAKRPAAPSQWKFCPHCGKDVKIEKSEAAPTPESSATGRMPYIIGSTL